MKHLVIQYKASNNDNDESLRALLIRLIDIYPWELVCHPLYPVTTYFPYGWILDDYSPAISRYMCTFLAGIDRIVQLGIRRSAIHIHCHEYLLTFDSFCQQIDPDPDEYFDSMCTLLATRTWALFAKMYLRLDDRYWEESDKAAERSLQASYAGRKMRFE